LKKAEKAGQSAAPEQCYKIMAEVAELCRKLDDEGKRLQLEFGISDSLLEALEQAQIPEFEERYWRKEVQQTPVAVKLESVVGAGFERLMSTVDQNSVDPEFSD